MNFDDVHDVNVQRMCFPVGEFDEEKWQGIKQRLCSEDKEERRASEPSMDENSLQDRAAANPVASAVCE